jgi:hypothetical protein
VVHKANGFSAQKFGIMLGKMGVIHYKWGWGGKKHAFLGIRLLGGRATVDEVLSNFLKERTEKFLGGRVTRKKLRSAFNEYIRSEHPDFLMQPGKQINITSRLGAKGYRAIDTTGGTFYVNLILKGSTKVGNEEETEE